MEQEQQHPTGPTFDTLKAAEALQKAGFTGVQARVVTQTIVDSQANLATKADLDRLHGALEAMRATVEANAEVQRADNQRLLAAFESHVAVLRAENKRMEETLRADNKRMEDGLRADMAGLRADNEQLKEKVNTNRTLILGVGVPVLLALVGLTFAVVSLSLR